MPRILQWWEGDWWNRPLIPPNPTKAPTSPVLATKPNTATGKPTPSKTLPNAATGLKTGATGKPKP